MKFIATILLCLAALLNADCLGDNPGEVYFKAFIKDNNGNYTRPALYKTIDYGQTAQVVIPDFDAFIHKDKTPGGFYKIPIGSSQLYYSADTCKTWVLKNTTLTNDGFQTGVFSGECWSSDWRVSKDYGHSWVTHAHNGLTDCGNSALGLLAGEAYYYQFDGNLYRTTDYGEHYTVVSSPNLGSAGVGRGWVPGELFIGTSPDRKYYRSLDSGQTLSYLCQLPEALYGTSSLHGYQQNEIIRYRIKLWPSMIYNQMEIKFFKTNDWYQTIDSVTTNYTNGIEENGEWRVESGELVNYPNPFNNSTLVNYVLSAASRIALAVYNSKGELVKKLYQGWQSAGAQQVSFNADGLNSGVYYIKLSGKNITRTTKCILLK